MEYKIDKFHQIENTTTYGKIATPNPVTKSWDVVNEVISNEYKNGLGHITFAREVKSIPQPSLWNAKT